MSCLFVFMRFGIASITGRERERESVYYTVIHVVTVGVKQVSTLNFTGTEGEKVALCPLKGRRTRVEIVVVGRLSTED